MRRLSIGINLDSVSSSLDSSTHGRRSSLDSIVSSRRSTGSHASPGRRFSTGGAAGIVGRRFSIATAVGRRKSNESQKAEEQDYYNGRRPKILAIHGKASNKTITQIQLENLNITDETYDIVYVNGPFEVEATPLTMGAKEVDGSLGDLASDSGSNRMSSLALFMRQQEVLNGPYYSWFPDNYDHDACSVQKDKTRKGRKSVLFHEADGQYIDEQQHLLGRGENNEHIFETFNGGIANNTTLQEEPALPEDFLQQNLLPTIIEEGPFDGIYGFSQGAHVATLIMDTTKWNRSLVHQLIQKKRMAEEGNIDDKQGAIAKFIKSAKGRDGEEKKEYSSANDYDEQEMDSLIKEYEFKFAIMVCPVTPCKNIETFKHQIRKSFTQKNCKIRVLHIIGKQDERFKARSEEFASLFAKCRVQYMDCGHEISRAQKQNAALTESVHHFILSQGRPPPTISMPAFNQVTPVASLCVLPHLQVALVKTDQNQILPASKFPGGVGTIISLLEAQDSHKRMVFVARETDSSKYTTYGEVVDFILGGDGDLRRIGVKPGEVVAYATPPGGAAVSVLAILTIASQTAAAPIAPNLTKDDTLDLLNQFHAKHMILFEGVECPGVKEAFNSYESEGKGKTHTAVISKEKPGMFHFRVPKKSPLQPSRPNMKSMQSFRKKSLANIFSRANAEDSSIGNAKTPKRGSMTAFKKMSMSVANIFGKNVDNGENFSDHEEGKSFGRMSIVDEEDDSDVEEGRSFGRRTMFNTFGNEIDEEDSYLEKGSSFGRRSLPNTFGNVIDEQEFDYKGSGSFGRRSLPNTFGKALDEGDNYDIEEDMSFGRSMTNTFGNAIDEEDRSDRKGSGSFRRNSLPKSFGKAADVKDGSDHTGGGSFRRNSLPNSLGKPLVADKPVTKKVDFRRRTMINMFSCDLDKHSPADGVKKLIDGYKPANEPLAMDSPFKRRTSFAEPRMELAMESPGTRRISFAEPRMEKMDSFGEQPKMEKMDSFGEQPRMKKMDSFGSFRRPSMKKMDSFGEPRMKKMDSFGQSFRRPTMNIMKSFRKKSLANIFGNAGDVDDDDDERSIELELDGEPLANEPGSIGLLLQTSGTTSKPKGVPLKQISLVSNGMIIAQSLQLTEVDVVYSVMPLYHIGGISASIMCTIASGGAICCEEEAFDPARMVEALAYSQPQPTWYSAVPTIHNATVNYIKGLTNKKLKQSFGIDNKGIWKSGHSLRMIRSGAAALLEPDAAALSSTYGNLPVYPTYSMSEQMPISQPPMGRFGELSTRPGSVGVPITSSLAIVDPETLTPLPFGTKGEIAISGPTVIDGYLDNPEANSKSFFELSLPIDDEMEGGKYSQSKYFLTGDLGVLDEDGYLYLKGRSKEMVKKGGEQISLAEVEAVLQEHPWVRIVVCCSIPSKFYGEEVGCAIVTSADAPKNVSTKNMIFEIRKFLKGKDFNEFKWPSKWSKVSDSELPKTNSNKYIRTGLADKLRLESDKTLIVDRDVIDGIRFVCSVYVMFMHIGSDKAIGAVANLRNIPWHVHFFFTIGGYSTALSMNPKIGAKLRFFFARVKSIYPMYFIALVLGLGNLLVACRPSTFRDTFHWTTLDVDKDLNTAELFCEGTPWIPDSYWGNLISTVSMYLLGLAVTPFWQMAWFMGYYLWFISMYFFCLFIYPFMYNAFYNLRKKKNRLKVYLVLMILLSYAFILAPWFLARNAPDFITKNNGHDDTEEKQIYNAEADRWVLNYYLFGPVWAIYYVIGICLAFLYDATAPANSVKARLWGHVADFCTLLLIAISCAVVAQGRLNEESDTWFLRPPEADSVYFDNLVILRLWDSIGGRLFCPLTTLYLYALSTGEGFTAKLYRSNVVKFYFVPATFGCFLFHQMVAQWYYLAVHGRWWNWWSDRKAFYWFSPYPCPVAAYEIPLVMLLTVLFATLMDRIIMPFLSGIYQRAKGLIFSSQDVDIDEETDAQQITCKIIEDATGIQPQMDWTLEECGVASIGLAFLAGAIKKALPSRSSGVTINDLSAVETVDDLVKLLEEKLGDALRHSSHHVKQLNM